jgi:hypothetical protein
LPLPFSDAILLKYCQLSDFPLRIHTVAMALQRNDIMHAALSNRGFFRKSASFLQFPDLSGTATGHDIGDTIVVVFQFRTAILIEIRRMIFSNLKKLFHCNVIPSSTQALRGLSITIVNIENESSDQNHFL